MELEVITNKIEHGYIYVLQIMNKVTLVQVRMLITKIDKVHIYMSYSIKLKRQNH